MIGIYDCFGYGASYDVPFEKRYKLIKNAGFDCVMLWWSDKFGRGIGYQKDVQFARNAGLHIENIHTPVHEQNCLSLDNLDGESVFQSYLQCVKDCFENNIATMVIHLPNDEHPINNLGIKRLKNIISEAEKEDVQVAFENLSNINNLALILSTFQSKNVGYCYDSCHHQNYAPNDDLLKLYGNRLIALHLQDNGGKHNQHQLPFDGSIDWISVITDYLNLYKLSAHELVTEMVLEVLKTTGITATVGIGTNLYLSKIAMDIQAKHIPADNNGMRIAELDEMSYRRSLWSHRPLTDFWRVGKGYAKKLEEHGLYTMGDIARCSLGKPADFYNENFLYKLFGINAELLIDHAWGWEPCTIADIKAYKPGSNSIGSGQVLQSVYPFDKAKLIVREMTDLLVLDLVDKRLVTDQLVLTVGYDIENLTNPNIKKSYHGEITVHHYGRAVPKSAHGSTNLGRKTSSTKLILDTVTELYERVVDKNLLIRRINITANHVVDEATVQKTDSFEQLDLFTDYAAAQAKKEKEEAELAREKRMQQAMLKIKKKYGKNAILKGMNLEDGATTVVRNRQIGGHKA